MTNKTNPQTHQSTSNDQNKGFESCLPDIVTHSLSGFCVSENATRTRTRTKSFNWLNEILEGNEMKKIFLPYKLAKVYATDKDAFTYFSYYSLENKKYVREKVRLGIKGLSLTAKKKAYAKLAAKINEEIKVRNKMNLFHKENDTFFPENKYIDQPLVAVFETFISDMENSEYQRTLALTVKNRVISLLSQKPALQNANASFFTKEFFKDYIATAYQLGNVGRTINEHLWIFSKVYQRLRENKNFDHNFDPETLRVKQVKNETERYKPLTFSEKDLILSYFKKRDPHYYRFLLFIYYTCIRPGEIMRLQINNINMKERTIYIPWFSSKNGLSNYIQILDPLYEILKEMEIEKYPDTHYLFSHKFEPGIIKKSSSKLSVRFTTAARNLNIIDKQMYGLKHTFNKDYVENNKKNIDWEWLRRHNRHATINQTQDYISGLTAYFLDETTNIILDHR